MERRPVPIGEILSDLGRISPSDVDRALAFQREQGGFFGDALVKLGLLTAEEVKFALADQYDLPFVQLRPDSIDPAVARMVPGEWAKRHQMLPVLRDGDTVTVILTVPPTAEEMEAVRRFTRAGRVEAAVSTAETIRSLIEAVHGMAPGSEVPLPRWTAEALDAGAVQLGVSVRGGRAQGWFRTSEGDDVRGAIGGDWRADLAGLIAPFDADRDAGVRAWPAILSTTEGCWRVECRAVEAHGAAEFVLRVGARIPADAAADATREVREAFAAAAARGSVVVRAAPEEDAAAGVLEALLPGLPEVLLGGSGRVLHLSDRPVAIPPGVLTLRPTGSLGDTLASLDGLALDALVLDVTRLDPDDLDLARAAAPLVVFRETPDVSKRLRVDLDLCLHDGSPLLWTHAS